MVSKMTRRGLARVGLGAAVAGATMALPHAETSAATPSDATPFGPGWTNRCALAILGDEAGREVNARIRFTPVPGGWRMDLVEILTEDIITSSLVAV